MNKKIILNHKKDQLIIKNKKKIKLMNKTTI